MRTNRRFRPVKLLAVTGLVLLGIWVGAGFGGQSPGQPLFPMAVDKSGLVLVNRWHPVPEDYAVDPVTLDNGQQVDRQCAGALAEMLADCAAEGLEPLVCSGYRSLQTQEELYQSKIRRLMQSGMSRADAETAAGTEVAYPGTSEHHTGLAVDIVDLNNQNLDGSQEYTPVQQWLLEHCWEYGFILRYPAGKSDLTGIIYEPWHYRYVGRTHAKAITRQGLCLEEYLNQ